MNFGCPGAKIFKEPKPEEIACPFCSAHLEIWSDEVKARCPNCKKIVSRKQAQNCFQWCKYARECAGEAAYKKYMENRLSTSPEE